MLSCTSLYWLSRGGETTLNAYYGTVCWGVEKILSGVLTITPAALPAVLLGCGACSSKPGVLRACLLLAGFGLIPTATLPVWSLWHHPTVYMMLKKKKRGVVGYKIAAFGKHSFKNSWQALCLGGFWKRNQNKASCFRDQKQINTSLFWQAVSLPFFFGSIIIISLKFSG